MSLLVALHSPVFGYCPKNETIFMGHHHCQAPQIDDEHDCHCGHEEEPVPCPCDGEHELISLDSGDYLWSAMGDLEEVKMSLIEDLGFQIQPSLDFPKEPTTVSFLSRPPPPDQSIFRRFSVLRL
jgi:hypothetical protein